MGCKLPRPNSVNRPRQRHTDTMLNHRASSRLCWALNFLTFIHDGTSFLRPALRVQDPLIWRRAGLVRAWDSRSCVGLEAMMIWSRVGTGSYRRGPLKRTRGKLCGVTGELLPRFLSGPCVSAPVVLSKHSIIFGYSIQTGAVLQQ